MLPFLPIVLTDLGRRLRGTSGPDSSPGRIWGATVRSVSDSWQLNHSEPLARKSEIRVHWEGAIMRLLSLL